MQKLLKAVSLAGIVVCELLILWAIVAILGLLSFGQGPILGSLLIALLFINVFTVGWSLIRLYKMRLGRLRPVLLTLFVVAMLNPAVEIGLLVWGSTTARGY